MKRRIGAFLLSFFVFFFTMTQTIPVYAASISLSGVPKKINIGKQFTVKVTLPDGVAGGVSVSYPTDILEFIPTSEYVTDTSGEIFFVAQFDQTVSLKFETKAAGSGKIKAYAGEVYEEVGEETLLPADVDGASASITVENESEDDTKSGDNSLASLKISPGRLSPSFKSGTLNYTATVNNSVTKINVDAKPNHAKAVVESVSGNENLVVGKNTVKVVVKAENGTKATYKITVTRKEKEAEDEEPELPSESESETEVGNPTIQSGDVTYWIEDNYADETLPDDFLADTISIGDREVNCASFSKGDLVLLSLKEAEDAEASWYVYDYKQKQVYPFIKLISENGYIILLLPLDTEIPDGYAESLVSIEGKGMIKAYQSQEIVDDKASDPESPDNTEGDSVGFFRLFAPEVVYADEVNASDFYLVYAMNQSGETNWYHYDNAEGTYLRYSGLAGISLEEDTEAETEAESGETLTLRYNKLLDEKKALQDQNRMMICVFVFVDAVLLIIIVNLIIFRNGRKKAEKEEDNDITFLDL